MHIPTARIISTDEARALIEPALAPRLPARDLKIALDDELGFADAYDRRGVLLLPEGAMIHGNLRLDYETAAYGNEPYRGILALGSLTVLGDVINDNVDGGPFLIVRGALSVGNMLKGGAPVIVFGPLVSPGMIYCEYNHGTFRAYGGIAAQGLIIDDQSHDIAGPVSGVKLVMGEDDASDYLLPEFFYADNDGTMEAIADLGAVLKARIRAGRPIFRDDAPAA
jgi:hypothetical protein